MDDLIDIPGGESFYFQPYPRTGDQQRDTSYTHISVLATVAKHRLGGDDQSDSTLALPHDISSRTTSVSCCRTLRFE